MTNPETLWWCPECKANIAPEQVAERDGVMRHYEHETSFDDTIPTHLLHMVVATDQNGKLLEETPAAPTAADTAAEAAHDALMARLIEAVYIQGVTSAKLVSLPAKFIPRTLVCAAVRGIEKLIEQYVACEQSAHPYSPQARAAVQARIQEDMAELTAALTEAQESLATVRAEFSMPQSKLIS